MVLGKVVPGLRQGRELGYPTVNIDYNGELNCEPGVYAARIYFGDQEFLGAAAVGGDFIWHDNLKLEVHIFAETEKERYGQTVRVELLERVGDMIRCANSTDLQAKIARDITETRAYFNR